jgi:tRNA(Arg) A34 adenosine deaminase TadA
MATSAPPATDGSPTSTSPSTTTTSTSDHERFMQVAIDLARDATRDGNEPFGAILVQDGEIVLRAQNSTHTEGSIVYHAELNLVRRLAEAVAPCGAKVDVKRCILYTSTEPCAMCSGAIFWCGIRTVVYGASNEALEKLAGRMLPINCTDIFDRAVAPTRVIKDVLAPAAVQVHIDFDWPKHIIPEGALAHVYPLSS